MSIIVKPSPTRTEILFCVNSVLLNRNLPVKKIDYVEPLR